MIVTNAALTSISTIPMSTFAEAPTFANPEHYPVVKAISSSKLTRENQHFVSPMVEGVILIQNYNLAIVYSPKKTQDLVHDPDGKEPILIGAVLSSLTSATPVSVPLYSLFQDFLCLENEHPITPPPHVPHGDIFKETYFSTHPQKHEHAIPFHTDANVQCLRLPVVLPKVKGLPIE